MWWANSRAAIGQRFNLEGIIFSSKVLTRDSDLLIPHLKVPNIRYINWEELHQRGFKLGSKMASKDWELILLRM